MRVPLGEKDSKDWCVTVTTRHGLDHTLNRRIYRFAAGSEGVVASPGAGIDTLDCTL